MITLIAINYLGNHTQLISTHVILTQNPFRYSYLCFVTCFIPLWSWYFGRCIDLPIPNYFSAIVLLFLTLSYFFYDLVFIWNDQETVYIYNDRYEYKYIILSLSRSTPFYTHFIVSEYFALAINQTHKYTRHFIYFHDIKPHKVDNTDI